MIKIPASETGVWSTRNDNEKLPDLTTTKNLDFDSEGYLRLAKPMVHIYSEDDDVDFDIPIGFFQANNPGIYHVMTNEATFYTDMYNSGNYGTLTTTQSSATNAPENTSTTLFADVVQFNKRINYMNPTDKKIYWQDDFQGVGVAWNIQDTSADITDSGSYAMTNFVYNSRLCVGVDSKVHQLQPGFGAGVDLTIDSDYEVTGVAYNNNFIGITTFAKNGFSNSMFIVWDGQLSSYNYVTEVPANTCYSPVPYRGTFAFIDSNGILQQWTPSGLIPLAALPVYYGGASFAIDQGGVNLNHSIVAEGELIHINMRSSYGAPGNDQEYYDHRQPGGLYTYDPATGLYHRGAPSGAAVDVDTVGTGDVNTSTDAITVTTAPETGTPARYSDAGGTAITGLTTRTLYYVIKVDATTIKLAETYTDAVNGTAIDLTGTGNANQTLQFYSKRDFGQTYLNDTQGCIYIEKTRAIANDLYHHRFFIGSKCAKSGTTEYACMNIELQDSENRGHFTTSKFLSSQLQDDWQKIFIKHKDLVSDLDKIVVKYRVDNDRPLTYIKDTNDGIITWSDSDTFTTTDTQWANVQAGDEVEIVQGTGAGYLAHVDSISEAGGTYTVNLDESIKNLTASDTGRAIASRWVKLTTLDNGIISNDDGYSEILVGVKSKQIQFKVELRGEDIEIEEILVAHELHKPVA